MTLSRRQFLAATTLAIPATRLHAAAGPVDTVATTGLIADAAATIGGAEVAVRALMGPNVDPHGYRQTRSDIAAMVRADLVLRHGLGLEAQMDDFLADLARRTPVVAVAEALPQNVLRAHDTYAGKFDPHVWMDPSLWSGVVAAVGDALITARPAAEALFRANAEAHLVEIARLSDYAASVLDTVPQPARVLLTAHDAFGYFGAAYGFEVIGIQGISTESEAGLNRIGELVGLIVDRGISAVFVEASVSDRNVRALVEGAAARGHTVRIGGELFSDSMGSPGTYEGTYLGMMDHNITLIAAALGGKAPQRGMDGRLSAGL